MEREYEKFALIGTSCVGKTTLLLRLNNIFIERSSDKKTVMVPEAARRYFEVNKVRKPFSFYHQSRIQQLAKKLEQKVLDKNPDIIICDRSVLDAAVYVHAMGAIDKMELLLHRVENWLGTYSYFFLLDPSDIPFKNDEVRREDIGMRQKFHDSFLFVLSQTTLPWRIISGSENFRTNDIFKVISNPTL